MVRRRPKKATVVNTLVTTPTNRRALVVAAGKDVRKARRLARQLRSR